MPPKDKSASTSTSASADEITGQSALPITRIKKIIQLDEDIVQCSGNATFVITMATEMFIQYLAQQGHNVVKSERKPRKIIQYKDLATAVSRIDNLEFLADVIPKTTTYKQFKEKKAKEASKDAPFEKGQRTLNGTISAKANGEDGQQAADKPSISPRIPSLSTLMVDRTVEAQPGNNDQDVEMADQ
ncbi:histone-fold domain-containing protein [Aspergillus clavatus NRRL 1]|uniref:CBF/NF-Y family transcription factor, putative n=1 Tax=Aspergillus clavatus (strain ATCC 1007 / CBS 513.65 / DSM 816 / NCTC 3887 / NRRL 1 / QM 1276 / 107) TaxID=344612 RepID=A1CB08_ASPCL|nr:CBF/NF-Y family transcription factor, putative [Aspergillus clavatus NRRL 1]EAW12926.1 CBF/NF-Y family transcription factor, putative [Aspergillus clavatus NRRL 1]